MVDDTCPLVISSFAKSSVLEGFHCFLYCSVFLIYRKHQDRSIPSRITLPENYHALFSETSKADDSGRAGCSYHHPSRSNHQRQRPNDSPKPCRAETQGSSCSSNEAARSETERPSNYRLGLGSRPSGDRYSAR